MFRAAPRRANTTVFYDIAGNITGVTDGDGNYTSYSYGDSYSDSGNKNAYAHVTTVTNALGQQSLYEWDYSIGSMTVATDPNGVQTKLAYGDPLDRLTQIRRAAGVSGLEAQTNVTYTSLTEIQQHDDQNVTDDTV